MNKMGYTDSATARGPSLATNLEDARFPLSSTASVVFGACASTSYTMSVMPMDIVSSQDAWQTGRKADYDVLDPFQPALAARAFGIDRMSFYANNGVDPVYYRETSSGYFERPLFEVSNRTYQLSQMHGQKTNRDNLFLGLSHHTTAYTSPYIVFSGPEDDTPSFIDLMQIAP